MGSAPSCGLASDETSPGDPTKCRRKKHHILRKNRKQLYLESFVKSCGARKIEKKKWIQQLQPCWVPEFGARALLQWHFHQRTFQAPDHWQQVLALGHGQTLFQHIDFGLSSTKKKSPKNPGAKKHGFLRIERSWLVHKNLLNFNRPRLWQRSSILLLFRHHSQSPWHSVWEGGQQQVVALLKSLAAWSNKWPRKSDLLAFCFPMSG